MKFTKLASLLLLANTFVANSYGAEPARPQELTESRLADGRVTLEELQRANPMTQYVVLLKNAKEQDIINMCEHQINDYVEACLNAKKRLETVTLGVVREYAATIRSGFDAKIAFSDPRNLFLTRSGFSRGLIGIDVPNPDRDNRRQEEAEQYSAAVNRDWAAIVNADNMALKTARENIVPGSEAEHILDWIEDEWSGLTAEKKLQVIRLIKLTYFNSYNLYNQFILRHLPGRTLLNRLNLARS